ncbi:MAG TPA: hypothetical protein ENI20_07470 [Bacteroides sp.]|nr:hypothetical protein [Bacteroides sp.]
MADNQNPKLGISSWTYPWAVGVSKGPRLKRRMDVLEILENARSLGIGLVQYSDNLPLENLPWETLVKLKRLSSEYNIKSEVGTRCVEPKHLLKFLEIAIFLKSPILRTLPCHHGKYLPVSEVEKNLREVLPEFEKEGVVIVLENQESYKAAELAAMMEAIDHPNLRICLDLANALGAMEGPEYVMSKLGPWCGNFHVKDVSVIRTQTHMEFLVEGRSAGNGNIPIKWALDQLKEFGVSHTTIIELWPPWQGDIESTVKLEETWVAESVEFMRRLF